MAHTFLRTIKRFAGDLRPSKSCSIARELRHRRLRCEPLEDRRLLSIHVWQGGAGGLWSVPANWNGGVPTNGEATGTIVQFGAGTTSTDNIVGLVVDQVHFTGGGNTISGSGGGVSLGISGNTLFTNIQNDTGTNTFDISLPMVLSVGFYMGVAITAGQVNLNETISGNTGIELLSTSTGTLQLGTGLGADASNTYTGGTQVAAGTLLLNKNGAAAQAIPDNLMVGDGVGAASSAVGAGKLPQRDRRRRDRDRQRGRLVRHEREHGRCRRNSPI